MDTSGDGLLSLEDIREHCDDGDVNINTAGALHQGGVDNSSASKEAVGTDTGGLAAADGPGSMI